MIEHIPQMLKLGKTGSILMVGVAGLMLIAYFITKAISNHAPIWVPEAATKLAIDGIRFHCLFLVLEIIAKKIGLV